MGKIYCSVCGSEMVENKRVKASLWRLKKYSDVDGSIMLVDEFVCPNKSSFFLAKEHDGFWDNLRSSKEAERETFN